ncbi:MAG: hypothetical protein ABIK73_05575 [candidate division WOR-3 bacterium]
MDFKLWSESNPKVKKKLKPDLGLRRWNNLSIGEKEKIWQYLKQYFFKWNPSVAYYVSVGARFQFYGTTSEKQLKLKLIESSIKELNDKYKVNCYAPTYLENPELEEAACVDFYTIFIKQDENVVLELLSIYSKQALIADPSYFDAFANQLNSVFRDFGLNICLARQGFIPRQEEKITKEIYEPVLKILAHPQWSRVNEILIDAFNEYRKNTPQSYSNCITNAIAALEAFLQIITYGKTGQGKISHLITEAQKKNLIPNDYFTQKIFDNIEAIIARERQETGIAHPKKEYANEKNARLVLNLIIVFIQHCLQ